MGSSAPDGVDASTVSDLIALDLDGDQRLEPDEFWLWAKEAYSSMRDDDGSRLASAFREVNRYTGTRPETTENQREVVPMVILTEEPRSSMIARTLKCDLPAANDAIVALISRYKSGNILDVAVGGQGNVSDTTEVNIEVGAEPLYVVALSYRPTVWRVTGDVARVGRFVVSGAAASETAEYGVGVHGLPRDVVTFLPKEGCMDRPGNEAGLNRLRDTIEQRIGKRPDVTISERSVARVALPSGSKLQGEMNYIPADRTIPGFVKVPEGLDGLFSGVISEFPFGRVHLDAKEVVSLVDLRPYDALPGQAGLLDLTLRGKLRQFALRDGGEGYAVISPMPRFPGGLEKAGSNDFVVCGGIPVPKGVFWGWNLQIDVGSTSAACAKTR
jgi:hypothetical protein